MNRAKAEKSVKITISLKATTIKILDRIAEELGIPRSSAVAVIMRDYAKRVNAGTATKT